MAADTNLLQGEVVEDPSTQKLDVEGLLAAFLRSLIEEQRGGYATAPAPAPSEGQVLS